jgi:hypothetical protein
MPVAVAVAGGEFMSIDALMVERVYSFTEE